MNVYLDSIGCRLNQSEIERYSAHFRMAGHELVGAPDESDLVVVNTCTVTSKAAADSRSIVRRINRRNPQTRIVLTGCWSTMEEAKANHLPGVVEVVQNDQKDDLVPQLLGLPSHEFDREPVEREPIPGIRMRTRAFIKAQDGCDNGCTFCITTIARGPSRSIPPQRVLNEIRAAVSGGAQEAVLSGVQLSSYGDDLGEGYDLGDLVRMILDQTQLPRLRISSLEPWNLPDGFFDLWEDPRLCRQLHLPLQSGCAGVLKRMSRPISPTQYAAIIEDVRAKIPEMSITTDVIVGFPGESDDEFENSLQFISEMEFAGAHVFTYSARPGTPASRIRNQVPAVVARRRGRRVREAAAKSASNYAKKFIGEELTILWETGTSLDNRGWEVIGLSDNYLRVKSTVPTNLLNTLSPVRISEVSEAEIVAELIPPR